MGKSYSFSFLSSRKGKFLFSLFSVFLLIFGFATKAAAAMPYAEKSPNGKTLTFYCDDQRASRSGTTYDLNTGTNLAGWISDQSYKTITNVKFDESFQEARPKTCYKWFFSMEKLTTITCLEFLNTSEVTDLSCMFYGCSVLSALNLINFETEKVKDMSWMFNSCHSITHLNLASFDTRMVESMHSMFSDCSNLTTIYVEDYLFLTNKVSDSGGMFWKCYNLLGENGTTYNSSIFDITYAHIDHGTSDPGYFTSSCYKAYAVKIIRWQNSYILLRRQA